MLVLGWVGGTTSITSAEGAAPDPAPTSSVDAPDDARPAEFTDVVQEGGVVAATAAPATPCLELTQRDFALVATEGSYNGFGLGFRVGGPRIGFDGSFAFVPLLMTFQANPDASPDFEILTSYQANATVFFGLYQPDTRTDLGIAVGYKYNSLMKHGFNVAFYLKKELGRHWALMGFAGPSIFPDAEDQIRERTGWKDGSVASGLAWHQAGLGLSLAFFP
jgi:hypothetical protein